MSSKLAPCIFGTTRDGFELCEYSPLPIKIEHLTMALTNSEAELSDRDTCIKIFRLKSKSETFTWIGLYRKAYEIGFSREGGYYGAGIFLSGVTVNSRLVLDLLNDLSRQVNTLAISNGKFQRTLSSIQSQLDFPTSLGLLVKSISHHHGGGLNPEASACAYIGQPESAREIIEWAQNEPLAAKFQAIIIAPATSFPRSGASSRIERFSDLASVQRKLDADLSAQLSKAKQDVQKLLTENSTLKSQNASLSLQADKATKEYKRLKDANQYMSELPYPSEERHDLIKWVSIVVIAASIAFIIGLFSGWLITDANYSSYYAHKSDCAHCRGSKLGDSDNNLQLGTEPKASTAKSSATMSHPFLDPSQLLSSRVLAPSSNISQDEQSQLGIMTDKASRPHD